MSPEDAALLAQIELTQRRLELRDHAWSGAPAQDLRAIGFPEPELCWGAACDIIAEQKAARIAALNRIIVLATGLDFAEENMAARGDDGILPRDLFAASARLKTFFGPKIGPRAAEHFAKTFIPQSLRGEPDARYG